MENQYINKDLDLTAFEGGNHRDIVGGLWDEIGQLQFDYMIAQGLSPTDRFIDVACGSMRGGRHFIPYLNAGHYYGFDILRELIDAGMTHEIAPLGMVDKVPEGNLASAADFEFPESWRGLDKGLALSLFTHLTLNTIVQCLTKLRAVMADDGVFYATIFETTEETQIQPQTHPHNIVSYMCQDPYHYTRADMDYVAQKTGWGVESLKGFGHPRGQHMVVFKAR